MEYGDNCRDLKEVLSQSDPSFDPTCGYLMSLLYTSLYFSNILQYIAYITASKVRHASQYKLYCIRAHLMQAWVPSFFFRCLFIYILSFLPGDSFSEDVMFGLSFLRELL